jgi:YggT family protein
MINILVDLVHFLARLAFVLVLVNVFLSYFMAPHHPFRRNIERIVEPFLLPIRKVLPPIANIDFSPIVLILLIQLVEYLLVLLLNYLR